MAELLDRRDLSEVFRWLASGIVFCAVTPLLFSDVHPWTSLRGSAGGDSVVSWVLGLATVVVAGKVIEGAARIQFGAYMRSRLFLESVGRGLSHATRRRAKIGWCDIAVAWVRRCFCWTHVPQFCIRALVPLLIEIANVIGDGAGYEGSLRLNPLQSLVMFLAVSQPRTGEKWRGVEVECSRGLDRFLLFLTLGQAFLLVGLVGVGAFIWSMWGGHLAMMLKQGAISASALLAALVAKAASGQAFQELLVYVGALFRGFVPLARQS